MLAFSRTQLLKASVVTLFILSIISLLLSYFIPAPPSKVVMATAFKGASFEYYGRQYREIFARSNVVLELRETAGAVENVRLLQDLKIRRSDRLCYRRCLEWKKCAGTTVVRDRLQSTILDILFLDRAD